MDDVTVAQNCIVANFSSNGENNTLVPQRPVYVIAESLKGTVSFDWQTIMASDGNIKDVIAIYVPRALERT